MNQLQAVALNEGLRCKKRLWREAGREQLETIRLAPWASRRRSLTHRIALRPTVVTGTTDEESAFLGISEAERVILGATRIEKRGPGRCVGNH